MRFLKITMLMFLGIASVLNTGYSIKKIVVHNSNPFVVDVQMFNEEKDVLNKKVHILPGEDAILYENNSHSYISEILLSARARHELVKNIAEQSYIFNIDDNNHDEVLIHVRANSAKRKINQGKNITNFKFNTSPLFFNRIKFFMSEQERQENQLAVFFEQQYKDGDFFKNPTAFD